ncbi:MAG: alpha/beta hydrolase [Bacteroidota bacterium]
MKYVAFFSLVWCCLVSWAQTPQKNHDAWLLAEVQGEGPDVIFIPGYGCRGEVWQAAVDSLKDHYRCHLITLRQFQGELEPEAELLAGTIQALRDYARTESHSTPLLVGHSIGGFFTLALAAQIPDEFAGLISVDALPYLAAVFAPEPMQMDPSATAQQYMAMDSAAFAQTSYFACRTMVTDPEDVAWVSGWSKAADRQAYGYLFAEFYNTDLRGELAEIEVPALMMVARGQGEAATMTIWKEQYQGLANSSFVYHPEALHFLMLDAPDWFLFHVRSFLSQHAPQ